MMILSSVKFHLKGKFISPTSNNYIFVLALNLMERSATDMDYVVLYANLLKKDPELFKIQKEFLDTTSNFPKSKLFKL